MGESECGRVSVGEREWVGVGEWVWERERGRERAWDRESVG